MEAIFRGMSVGDVVMSEIGKKRYPQKPISDAELAKWGRYWYGRLRDFHQAGNGWEWRFSEPQVISFARRLLADGVPAWKRLKVVENLGWYRDHVLKTDEPSLDFSRRKLKEAVALEKHNAASDEANDVPIRMWIAAQGGLAFTSQGPRFRSTSNHHSTRERRQGSNRAIARIDS